MSITIGLPFYNAEKHLELAIKSVFAQTYQDWELLLIDDGSTDTSLEIAKSIKDQRVTVYSDGNNKKLAARLNEIVKLAKYDYIARMDADDFMAPTRLSTQIKILEDNPKFDLVSTGLFSISNTNILMGYRGHNWENPTFDEILYKKTGVLHPSVMGRKAWFERNKYNEDLKLGQDTELWLRTSKKNDFKIKIISNPLFMYREEGNVTKKKLLRAYKNEREYLALYIEPLIPRIMYKLKSWAKSLFVTVFGTPKFLLERRFNSVNDNQREIYDNVLKQIRNTQL
ncbi:glycosyltransferase family 2 protein [Thalassobellus suaedae]|uniref:Glycosyltransferase family 2 protein n=1 Tax=Thalassobellus suaedae TaxID=3074124 RepID=A0ABY9Y212_9FLAO|nr:glycosyltransferase family 2 protein [Flavobacteriaceae bacterium HL-DH10]